MAAAMTEQDVLLAREAVATRDWVRWYKAQLGFTVHLERDLGNKFGKHIGDIWDASNALAGLVAGYKPTLAGYSVIQREINLTQQPAGVARVYVLKLDGQYYLSEREFFPFDEE